MKKKEKDPKRVKAGRKSIRKGKAFELLCANLLSEWFYGRRGVLRRVPLRGRQQERYIGDIVQVEEMLKVFPFIIDVKARDISLFDLAAPRSHYGESDKSTLITDVPVSKVIVWMSKIIESADRASRIPLLIIKNKRRPAIVIWRDHDFKEQSDWTGFKTPFLKTNAGLYVLFLEDLLKINPEALTLWWDNLYWKEQSK